jgi:hypothetical protein
MECHSLKLIPPAFGIFVKHFQSTIFVPFIDWFWNFGFVQNRRFFTFGEKSIVTLIPSFFKIGKRNSLRNVVFPADIIPSMTTTRGLDIYIFVYKIFTE